jgi:hypothetical protein
MSRLNTREKSIHREMGAVQQGRRFGLLQPQKLARVDTVALYLTGEDRLPR